MLGSWFLTESPNDSKIKDIVVSKKPLNIAYDKFSKNYAEDTFMNKIYVANSGSRSVSVINNITDTKPHDIPVGKWPSAIAINPSNNMIYVVNRLNNTVSVINGTTDKKETHDIPVGKWPSAIAINPSNNMIYVVNRLNNTVSVINGTTDKKEAHDIPVGREPWAIAIDEDTNMIYVTNRGNAMLSSTGSVSVIDGSSDKVAAGIIFNTNPINSVKIICNNKQYPTNIYLYVDAGTNCTAQPDKDFLFNTWVESPPSNRNSSIPLQSNSSGNLTVNRYGTFTVNSKHPQPLSTQDLFNYLTGALGTAVAINGAILTVPGILRTRKQSKTLSAYLYKINDKYSEFCNMSRPGNKSEYLTFLNTLRKDIISLVQKRAINESQYQILDDKITEYANRINDENA